MKKNSVKFIILFLFLFISVQIVFAYSSPSMQGGQYFGGKIINTKASEIVELEAGGYSCGIYSDFTSAKSITIRSIKGPTTYAIEATPKTKSIISVGKWILGKYTPKTTNVTCSKTPAPPAPEEKTFIMLNTITMFGTS